MAEEDSEEINDTSSMGFTVSTGFSTNVNSTFSSYVIQDNFDGLRIFFSGVEGSVKNMIATKCHTDCTSLCTAAMFGNTESAELIVKECHMDIKKGCESWDDDFFSVSPLWCAASTGKFEKVKKLQELGDDINAASNNGMTLVNYACSLTNRETMKVEFLITNRDTVDFLVTIRETVEFLVRQEADINRPDKRGKTCLSNSVNNLELCEFLLKNGARVNAKDKHGNTALHYAITKGNLKTMDLLLDHGSDQNIKNNLGDDALQLASILGNDPIVKELKARQKPTLQRWIESLLLVGSHCALSRDEERVQRAAVYWRTAVTLRALNPFVDLREVEPSPVGRIAQSVITVEKLEELLRDRDMVQIYAIENRLRILGSRRNETTDGLLQVSKVFARNENKRRSFDLLTYAFKLLQERTSTWTIEYICVLRDLLELIEAIDKKKELKFQDVIGILEMVTSKAPYARGFESHPLSITMPDIITLVRFGNNLDKNPSEMDQFKQVVHRLVRTRLTDEYGSTFLHYAAQQSCFLRVVEVLLECGADANAKNAHNSTALHSCFRPPFGGVPVRDKERCKLLPIFLKYNAHIDIVNDNGDFADGPPPPNILDHINLKCLATAVIRDHQITYAGHIPTTLESYVQMHGRYPSNKFLNKS